VKLASNEPLHVQYARALDDLDQARRLVGSLRGRVEHGQDSAASLTAAEWTLSMALKRVDRLRSQADYQPLDAA
jgi:hypothetical protein